MLLSTEIRWSYCFSLVCLHHKLYKRPLYFELCQDRFKNLGFLSFLLFFLFKIYPLKSQKLEGKQAPVFVVLFLSYSSQTVNENYIPAKAGFKSLPC